MKIKWNAEKYTQDFTFVHQYGQDLIELIDREKCHTVLDLGCGNGALTKRLAEEGFVVTGLDASPALLQIAKNQYPSLSFYEGDATNFKFDQCFDAVFSNAVLHWIEKDKQTDMLKCVFNSLNHEGQFIFEFGGFGNNKIIHAALHRSFAYHHKVYQMPFYFPTIGEYTSLLETAGFQVVYAVLFNRFTALKGENGLYDWIQMFIKEPFQNISEEEKEIILQETISNLKESLFHNEIWYADYVRIRCKAIKR